MRAVSVRGACLAGVVAALVSCAPAAAAGDVRITEDKQIAPRVVELTISTPAFTTPTHVLIDLPVGYDADPDRRWPVTYVLAGTMNTYKTFNSFVDGVKLTESFPSIVVSPNGDSGYWSDWYNGGAFGPPMYETYVIDQLIPLIDARFRTIADRSQRAVMGVSMGGSGSMMFAAKHPDLFVAASSISGAVDSNLPANGAVLSASSEFDGAPPDAIYGPRATQEVRWHGHNPTDLAANLRDLDLQVRTANGIPNPGIGEQPATADSVSCIVEGGVHMASVDLHDKLTSLGIPHVWMDYGPGCHTKPNFIRELADTMAVFAKVFARDVPAPAKFDYTSIEPHFDVWGWHVDADPQRALEFLTMTNVTGAGLTLAGSGATAVTSPPVFRGVPSVAVSGASPAKAVPDAEGRIRFTVDLGPADAQQQYTPGATTTVTTRTVTFSPAARTVCRSRRTATYTLPRGATHVQLRVDGRRRAARMRKRRVTVSFHGLPRRAVTVRITARAKGRTYRRVSVIHPCA